VWSKEEDVTTPGSVEVSADITTRLAGCLKLCAYDPNCVGIEYRYSDSAPCRYFPASVNLTIESDVQPAARTVQYRLINRCHRGTPEFFSVYYLTF